jgi:hypothetical protein
MAGTPPVSGEAYTFYISVVSQADNNIFKASPTIAAGDFTTSNDEGASFSNPATLPVVVAGNNKVIKIVLSIAEMTPSAGDKILVAWSDQAGSEWQDGDAELTVTPRAIDDLAFPVVSGRGIAVDTNNRVDANAIIQIYAAGAIEVTYPLTEAGSGDPIANATVWITTDAPGNNTVWRGTTDNSGIARGVDNAKPWLTAGTYYVWSQKAGYTFPNPDTEIVS